MDKVSLDSRTNVRAMKLSIYDNNNTYSQSM